MSCFIKNIFLKSCNLCCLIFVIFSFSFKICDFMFSFNISFFFFVTLLNLDNYMFHRTVTFNWHDDMKKQCCVD